MSHEAKRKLFDLRKDSLSHSWNFEITTICNLTSKTSLNTTLKCIPLWRCGPTWAMTSPFLRLRDHTPWRTAVCRTPLVEWSARRRDLYLTIHNIHNRKISMPPEGFELTFSAGERPQTYDVDSAAFGWSRIKTRGPPFIVNIRHEF